MKRRRKVRSKTFYIQYVRECPKCGNPGRLMTHYFRDLGVAHWRGPYFGVSHYAQIYSSEKYRKYREMGLLPMETIRKHCKIDRYMYECYFGKYYPGKIKKPVPHPEGYYLDIA